MTLRLLLAHPEPFFRACLAEALDARPGVEVVAVTGDEREAAALAGAVSAGAVLTAAVLDQGSGLSLARRIHETLPVVILTREHAAETMIAAAQTGAGGCISHDSGLERLAELVATARLGRFVVDPDRLQEALKKVGAVRSGAPEAASPLDVLSPRQREILAGIAEGLDNEAIARRLYLSPNTVRTHAGNILKKLGVHSRAEAARLALREEAAAKGTRVLHVAGPDLPPR